MKEKNETSDVDKNLLDCFWDLAEKDTDTRVQTSLTIINILHKKQNEAPDKNKICKDLEYAVVRLIKGLASSRDAARLGYTLVLTELLKEMEIIQVEVVLELIGKHLSLSSKQEKRDMMYGQVFGYNALVRSGRLKNCSHLSFVVTSLFQLSIGKSYLLRTCYDIFLCLFSQITEDHFKENIWPSLKIHLSCGWEKCTTDVFWLLLLCTRLFPKAIGLKFFGKKWSNEDLFLKDNYNYLKRMMKQTTSVLPMVHPLCSEFVTLVLQRKDFTEIWTQVIEENLFKAEQAEKVFLGFQMIKLVMQNSTKKKVVKVVLSARFSQLFTNSMLYTKHHMNTASTQLAEILSKVVKDSTIPEIQMLVLKAFLFPPGITFADQLLTKKEVTSIILNLLPDAVKEFCEMLKAVVLGKSSNSYDDDDDDEEDTKNRQQFQAVIQIRNLASHQATISDFDWRLDTIKFLFFHSSFEDTNPNMRFSKDKANPVSEHVRAVCACSFTKALDSLNRRTKDGTATLQQFAQFLMAITEYADQLMEATDNVTPVFDLDKVKEPWNAMMKIVKKLSKQSKKDGKTKESYAFQILFLQLGLELFQDVEHIAEVLEELHVCCTKALKARKHADDSTKEPAWIAVVLDILLSLLSKSSVHMRHLVSSVFPLLFPFITSEALQQILDVVDPSKSSEESILVNESDEEDEKDVEFESGTSSDDDEANNKVEEMDDDFKQKIEKALGPAASVSDTESETILTDSEMFKLDDALSEAFRIRKKPNNKQLSTEDKTMLNFRVRCLDLIISYIKSEPPMMLILQCIEPLLAAYKYGSQNKHQSALNVKAVAAIQFLTRVKSFKHCNVVEESKISKLLDILIEKCHKETNVSTSRKLYSLCMLIVRCLRKLKNLSDSDGKQQVNGKIPVYIKKYIATLEPFVKQTNSHISPHFFVSLMDAVPEFAWKFVKPLREYAFDSNVRLFKRSLCFGLLLKALTYSKSQETVSSTHWLEYGNKTVPLAVETVISTLINSDIKPLYTTELLDVILTSHKIVKEKTDVSLLESYPELLACLNNMSIKQVKSLGKKGAASRRGIILSLGGNVTAMSPLKSKKVRKSKKEKRKPTLNKMESDLDESKSTLRKESTRLDKKRLKLDNKTSKLVKKKSKSKKEKRKLTLNKIESGLDESKSTLGKESIRLDKKRLKLDNKLVKKKSKSKKEKQKRKNSSDSETSPKKKLCIKTEVNSS